MIERRGARYMRDAERFSALIGDIYDAALDPSRWVTVLAQIARFVGGPRQRSIPRALPTKS
jgi:hypothetical protein